MAFCFDANNKISLVTVSPSLKYSLLKNILREQTLFLEGLMHTVTIVNSVQMYK